MEFPTTLNGLTRWIGVAQIRAIDEWARARGLSIEQARTLGWLAENPGAMQRDIARMTRTTAASVSSLLQGLEKRGLIERRTEEGDDRAKRVSATPAGIDIVSGFDTSLEDLEAAVLAPLEPAERDTLLHLLTKVARALPEPQRP